MARSGTWWNALREIDMREELIAMKEHEPNSVDVRSSSGEVRLARAFFRRGLGLCRMGV